MATHGSEVSGVGAVNAYWVISRQGVAEVIRLLGGSCEPSDSLDDLLRAFEQARSRLQGAAGVAKRLNITQDQVLSFVTAMRRVINTTKAPLESSEAVDNAAIAALRLLDLLDRIKEANAQLTFSTALPDYGAQDAMAGTRTQQQVRALELLIRSLINEAYGSQDRLRAHFEAINKAVVEKWVKDADKGDLLSGSMFGELISLFTNTREYPPNYEKLFAETPFLTFLDEKRATLETFLSDIRGVRNRVAHHKRVTPVQVALLDHYYREIVEPLQAAFDRGRTRVNPDEYFEATQEQIKHYFGRVESAVQALGDDVDAVKADLGELKGEVRGIDDKVSWLKHKVVWILAGVAVVGAIGILTLGTSSKTLLNTDVIKTDVNVIKAQTANVKQETSSDPRKELQNRGVLWNEQDLRAAITQNDVDTVKLFMAGGMKWRTNFANDALKRNETGAVEVLLQNLQLLDPHENDCILEMNMDARIEPLPPGTPYDDKKVQAHRLSDIEARFLKATCSSTANVKYAQSQLELAQKNWQSQKDAYDRAKAAIMPVAQCRQHWLANDAAALRQEASMFNPTATSTFGPRDAMVMEVYTQMLSGVYVPAARLAPVVDKYCNAQASEEPNISINDWPVQSWKQVVRTVS